MVAGHGILEFSLVLLLAAGVVQGIRNPYVLGSIALLGGWALILMGLLMLRDVPHLRLELREEPKEGRRFQHPIWSGLLLSAANPYFILWWATAGLVQITAALFWGLWGLLLFYVGHILSDLVWYSFVSTMVATGKRFLSDTVYRGFIALCALALLAFGLWFGCEGGHMVLRGEFTPTARQLFQEPNAVSAHTGERRESARPWLPSSFLKGEGALPREGLSTGFSGFAAKGYGGAKGHQG
jgi:threonine/homoserine/homoserine lactone efflux protein